MLSFTTLKGAADMDFIGFIFDTNAHSYLADSQEFEQIIRLLESQKGTLVPHFSPINFFEYVSGINEENLGQRQNYLRAIRDITLGGSVLPSSKLHIRHSADLCTIKELESDVQMLLHSINRFLSIRNFNHFKLEVQEIVDGDRRGLQDIAAGFQDTADLVFEARKQIGDPRELEEFDKMLGPSISDDHVLNFVQHFLKRFDMDLADYDGSTSRLFGAVPSLRYFIDVYMHLVRRSVLDAKGERKARASDYSDLEQVLYLNTVDYIVTRDRSFRSLVNECGNEELAGRAISPESFVSLLSNTIVAARAPQRAKRIWVGTS
jgi:hypothetical protein